MWQPDKQDFQAKWEKWHKSGNHPANSGNKCSECCRFRTSTQMLGPLRKRIHCGMTLMMDMDIWAYYATTHLTSNINQTWQHFKNIVCKIHIIQCSLGRATDQKHFKRNSKTVSLMFQKRSRPIIAGPRTMFRKCWIKFLRSFQLRSLTQKWIIFIA